MNCANIRNFYVSYLENNPRNDNITFFIGVGRNDLSLSIDVGTELEINVFMVDERRTIFLVHVISSMQLFGLCKSAAYFLNWKN